MSNIEGEMENHPEGSDCTILDGVQNETVEPVLGMLTLSVFLEGPILRESEKPAVVHRQGETYEIDQGKCYGNIGESSVDKPH